jgi:hypothetical protein
LDWTDVDRVRGFGLVRDGFHFHVAPGQKLTGDGTVLGPTTIDGTLAPSLFFGTLTFNSTLVLAGTTDLGIDKTGVLLTSDLVNLTGGVLTLGGVLNVTATGDALAIGDTFNLFDGPAIAGAFDVLNLPLFSEPSYSWDTSKLAVNGTIVVIPEPRSILSLLGSIGLLLGLRRRRS